MSLGENGPRRAGRKTHQSRSGFRDGMHIDWDIPVAMDDGLVLRADVYRPAKGGKFPVILSYGPYAKDHRKFADLSGPVYIDRQSPPLNPTPPIISDAL